MTAEVILFRFENFDWRTRGSSSESMNLWSPVSDSLNSLRVSVTGMYSDGFFGCCCSIHVLLRRFERWRMCFSQSLVFLNLERLSFSEDSLVGVPPAHPETVETVVHDDSCQRNVEAKSVTVGTGAVFEMCQTGEPFSRAMIAFRQSSKSGQAGSVTVSTVISALHAASVFRALKVVGKYF